PRRPFEFLPDRLDRLCALLGTRSIDIEEDCFRSGGANLTRDPLNIRHRRSPVEVDTEHIHAPPGKLDSCRAPKAARRAEDERPMILAELRGLRHCYSF